MGERIQISLRREKMKMWLNMSLKVVKRIIAFPFMLCWLILFPLAELFAWAVNGITGEDIIDKE